MDETLSQTEIERYARHLVIRDIGGPGQQKLKAAHVAVIGAGGLGAPCLLYLAAAGVGTLTIIDDDSVALSNLQRQIIHPTARVGDPKVESAADALEGINPHVALIKHETRLSSDNAAKLLEGADVVVDGSDSFETRADVACGLRGTEGALGHRCCVGLGWVTDGSCTPPNQGGWPPLSPFH
jgi:molybdopterin/thiamine biosynthesis adenylyltransferase